MSRMIGFVYRYASYFTTFLTLMSVVSFFVGHMALGSAVTEQHCRLGFRNLPMARVSGVGEDSRFCRQPLRRAGLFIR